MKPCEASGATGPLHRFKLYVAGDSPNSVRAKANLERLCRARFGHAYSIVVIDVLRDPLRALAAGIVATPSVVRDDLEPARLVMGDLRDEAEAISALGLPAPTEQRA